MTRVSDLTGAELDYWVARSCGWKQQVLPITGALAWFDERGRFTYCVDDFHPHEDWSQGRPMMEEYGICLGKNGPLGTPMGYEAGYDDGEPQYGPTPLVAAMRSIVEMKFGDQVADPS